MEHVPHLESRKVRTHIDEIHPYAPVFATVPTGFDNPEVDAPRKLGYESLYTGTYKKRQVAST